MGVPSKPVDGRPVFPFLSDTEMWSQILDMLGQWMDQNKIDKSDNAASCSISISNETGSPILAGQLIQLSTLKVQVLAEASLPEELIRNIPFTPIFTVTDPVWHTAIDRIVIASKSIDDDFSGPISTDRLLPVPITNVPAAAGPGWVMPDPTDPTKLKFCKTSGIYRVVDWYDRSGDTEDCMAVVDTQEKQTFWRYELTENSLAPADTTAKLLDLEGTDFSAGNTIELSDPDLLMDDQVTGNKGWCIHVGNKFYAIQAVC